MTSIASEYWIASNQSKSHGLFALVYFVILLTSCASADESTATADEAASKYVNTAIYPVPRWTFFWKNRDNLGWLERHGKILVRVQQQPAAGLIFLGDSITHRFEHTGSTVWERDFAQWNPINMGFAGDRTQHVLWRIENGTLDGISPKVAIVMIGTNNWHANKADEIARGTLAVCDAIRERLPETQILLLALFPRNKPGSPQRMQVDAVNVILEHSVLPERVHWLDIGAIFLDDEGVIADEVMPDLLHPSAEGYELWSRAMLPRLEQLISD